jgi:hypothetical protein
MNAIEHAWGFLTEARKIPSFATSDERLRDGTWMIASVGGTHRDADVVEASNHYTVADMLKEVDPDYAAHDWITCSHWAVGWVQHLIVDPSNEAILRAVGEIGCALSEYPILSENRHSQLEMEWHEEGKCGEGCSRCEAEKQDAGCYGDGALGHQHTREACAAKVEEIFVASPERDAVIAALRGEMSDDASEEDDACDMLNEACGYRAVAWGWQDGDFGLWEV